VCAISLTGLPAYGAELPASAKGLTILNENAHISGDGPKFDYQGVMAWSRLGRVKQAAAATFWYRGPADQPAISSRAHGAVISGLNLWRFPYSKERVKWDGAVGYRFVDPASSTRIANQSLAGWDTAILIAKSNHCECFFFENLHSHANRVFFRNEENQSVLHSFRGIYAYREFETLFQFADVPERNGGGGNIDINTVVMQYPGLLLDIQKSNVNSCWFDITNLKIDGGNMNGWKLVRQRKGPLWLRVRGLIGRDAPPAADAIDVADKSHLDVQLYWNGHVWPRDYEHDGTAWRVKK
jgi:hypothetical protein